LGEHSIRVCTAAANTLLQNKDSKTPGNRKSYTPSETGANITQDGEKKTAHEPRELGRGYRPVRVDLVLGTKKKKTRLSTGLTGRVNETAQMELPKNSVQRGENATVKQNRKTEPGRSVSTETAMQKDTFAG